MYRSLRRLHALQDHQAKKTASIPSTNKRMIPYDCRLRPLLEALFLSLLEDDEGAKAGAIVGDRGKDGDGAVGEGGVGGSSLPLPLPLPPPEEEEEGVGAGGKLSSPVNAVGAMGDDSDESVVLSPSSCIDR